MKKKIIVFLCIIFSMSGCTYQNKVVKYDENKLKLNPVHGLSYLYESEELEINDENKDVLKMICEAVVDKNLTLAEALTMKIYYLLEKPLMEWNAL